MRTYDKKYGEYVRKVAKLTHNTLAGTLSLMEIDKKKYKASHKDYYNFKFYALTEEEKKTFLTNGYNNILIKKYNNPLYIHYFDNKEEFNKIFNEYLGRAWCVNKKMSFIRFLRLSLFHKYLIYKPLDKTQGEGIEKIILKHSCYKIYKELKSKEYGLVEEYIKQHKELSEFEPLSVNTIRISTINDNGCNIIYAGLRLGNGLVVDNFHAGGVIASINIETGIVVTRAINLDGVKRRCHPTSKKPIKGFKIPYWDRIIGLINEVYDIVPNVGYVAWDIAITPKGPIIVEGNANRPGYTVIQLPYVDLKKGMKYKIKKFIKKDVNN